MLRASLSPVLGVLLSLLLIATGHNMAMARGAAGATGQMVICTGAGPVVVYMDAEGAPTDAPHICPDCILVIGDLASPVILTPPTEIIGTQVKMLRRDIARACDVETGFKSRAPPAVL
ncbi:hypothetical protein CEP88_18240 [Roseobacter denitrificans]|nr:hypothetical protein [Roseobacter denitrificans]AVL54346.1 hypothetical protein CEP88_18240 [Roseobacter denitrificans]SFF99277.1 hypothetical protein SAMN05443635_105129 [Roseobacter denitrificans OCh 114]